MLEPRTALGIDVSGGLITLALLKKGRDGVTLVDVARGPVPDGAVVDGDIKDASALARAIKRLKARNQTLDFVRRKRLEHSHLQSEQYLERLAKEINAVVRFYDMEGCDKNNRWQVTLVTDIGGKLVDEVTDALESKLDPVKLEIRKLEYARTSFASGLAMKLLGVSAGGLDIDLLPPERIQARTAEKQTLAVANVAAILILLIILSIGFLSAKVHKVNADIEPEKLPRVSRNTSSLLHEHGLLQRQITDASEKLDLMKDALDTGSVLRWDRILTDIRRAIPKAVLITELFSNDGSTILINGQALSHDAIHH